MDRISKQQRSYNMSRIRSKNTIPELIVRKLLFKEGIRYRIHVKDILGKPDIAIKKYKTVIEIKGCFWHGHKRCKLATIPKSNQNFWISKINRNIERDKNNSQKLKKMNYKVFTIWECELKNEKQTKNIIDKIIKYIRNMKSK